MKMERNEETLSTRDLAQPNEPAADGGVAADPVADDAKGGRVYDQEQLGRDQPATAVEAPDETGIGTRADEHASTAETAPAGDARAATAAREESATRTIDDRAAATTVAGAGTTNAGAGTPDAGAAAGTGTGSAGDAGQLLSTEDSSSFQRRWDEVQTRFVDEPRRAVEDADGLVANLMQQLAESFAQERERLEAQWDRGEDISTEDLRIALQRYRSFFQRLLSA
jgi:hypothetical protein